MPTAHPASDQYNTKKRCDLECLLKGRFAQKEPKMSSEEFTQRLSRIHQRYPVYHLAYEFEYRAQIMLKEGRARAEAAAKRCRSENAKVPRTTSRNQEMLAFYKQLVANNPNAKKTWFYAECAAKFDLNDDNEVAKIIRTLLKETK